MTTRLTDHAKSILRAIADGKTIQERNDSGEWAEQKMLVSIAWNIANNSAAEFRIAPETRTINGVTFAAPVEYTEGDYALIVSAPGFSQRNFWFVKESDLAAVVCAIIDALEGKTK
jgi:hypothetical protein